MKKGQIAVMVVLVIAVVVLTSIMFVQFSDNQIIEENGEDLEVGGEIEVTERREAECVVGEPFFCDVQSVSSEGISLNIKNVRGDDYFIKSISVSDCRTGNFGLSFLGVGSSQVFEFSCSLEGVFFGDLDIRYKRVNGGPTYYSNGSVVVVSS